jgi:hypothetical protein
LIEDSPKDKVQELERKREQEREKKLAEGENPDEVTKEGSGAPNRKEGKGANAVQ